MGPISVSRSIDASRERVFDTVCDLALRPSFCDHFLRDYRLARVESSGVGAAARYRVSPVGPGSLWVETAIAEAERPHRVRERGRCGRLGRIPVLTTWEILAGRGLTEVRLTFSTEPSHPADRLREMAGAGRWYGRQWSKALRRLGELVEGEQAPTRVGVGGGDRAWTGVF